MSARHAGSLTELLQQKEKEWKEVQELRVHSLETALQEKEKHLNNEKLRFKKLKEDFEYNLKLLEERDSELQRYDVLFSELKTVHTRRDGEVSELKIQLDELRVKFHHEQKTREASQNNYKQRLREHQQELEKFRFAKDAEVKQERQQFETFKRELQSQLRAAEEDVELQRQELATGFDEALRKREHEFRLKADDTNSALLASEIKVKMLTKELELLRATEQKSKDELDENESNLQELEKKLRQKEWELLDERNMGEAKIADLENQLLQHEASTQKMQQHFQHKLAELDRYAREKEASLVAAKESHHERERSLEEGLRQLQNQVETEQVEYRRLEWSHKDVLKEKELQEQRLQAVSADLKAKLDTQAAEHGRSTVARDLELEALRQNEEKMRLEITQRKEDIDRYKRELAMAVERESSFERIKSQLDADWQRRCEDTERDVYEKQEELLRNLTKSRNEEKSALSAKVNKLEATVTHLQSLVNQTQEEGRQKQLAADQLQYELSTQSRRASDETAALKHRLADVELQLAQTRREADEYYKSGLETNAQATSLRNQLSSLKLELAAQGKAVPSFDPQSAVVTQLQGEVNQLRAQLKMDPRPGVDLGRESHLTAKPGHESVARLQSKLKAAAQRIDQLAREKEQLIQMGNRLRAELARHTSLCAGAGCCISHDHSGAPVPRSHSQPRDTKPSSGSRTPGQLAGQLHSKLSAVEKLQYQLTTHELQFAQHRAEQELHAADEARITVKSSSSDTSPSDANNAVGDLGKSRPSQPQMSVGMSGPVTKRPEAPVPTQQHSSPVSDQPLFTSSSEGQTSLQEIWKLLDNEESFRSPTPGKDRPITPRKPQSPGSIAPDHISASGGGFTLKGQRTGVESRPGLQRPVLSKKAAGKARSKVAPKRGRVRNYNVKSD